MWTWALRWSVPASCHLGWRDGGLLWLLPYSLPSVLTHHTLESRCIMGNGLRWVTSFDRKVSSVHRYKLNCQLNRLTLILVLFSEYATWAKKKKRQLFVIFILLTKSRTAITNKCLNKQSLTNTEWIKIVQKIGEMEQFGLKRNKLVCDREYLKTQIFLFCYDCIIVSFCGETGDGTGSPTFWRILSMNKTYEDPLNNLLAAPYSIFHSRSSASPLPARFYLM